MNVDKRDTSYDNVDIDNFLIKINHDRTIINKSEPSSPDPAVQDKMAFMESIEKDANRRAAERKQRELVAQELRK